MVSEVQSMEDDNLKKFKENYNASRSLNENNDIEIDDKFNESNEIQLLKYLNTKD